MVKNIFKILFFVYFTKVSFGNGNQNFKLETDVLFLLRIRNRDFSKEDVLKLVTKDDLQQTAFDPSKPVIFQVHGFAEGRRMPYHLLLSKSILDTKDVNLFFVDWSKGALTIDYNQARKKVNDVAQAIAEFINFMNSNYNISPSNVCCIGFSLGAHICGMIHKSLSKGSLNKIYGLDPAGPLFSVDDQESRLNPKSSTYVECIHTGFPLGIRAPICKVDFFINKGIGQPGCTNIFGVDNIVCSHNRVVFIAIEAMKNPKNFYGKSCDSYENALKGNCNDEPGAFVLDEDNALKNRSGIFHVITNAKEPFGRGKE